MHARARVSVVKKYSSVVMELTLTTEYHKAVFAYVSILLRCCHAEWAEPLGQLYSVFRSSHSLNFEVKRGANVGRHMHSLKSYFAPRISQTS